MEISEKILILFLFLNNGMVKGDIIEEMLIAVHQLQANMNIVMNKVENIENNLKVDVNSIKQDIKVLHEEVERTSNQDKIFTESLENIKNILKIDVQSIKQNVKVLNEEVQTNSNQDKVIIKSLENIENILTDDMISLKQNIKVLHEEVETNHRQGIARIKQYGEKFEENCLKPNNVYLENIERIKEEIKSVNESLKERAKSVQENAEKNYLKIDSDLKKISTQNLELFHVQKLHSDNEYSYYKVPVSNGTRLAEGSVEKTCEKVGLRAVCNGKEECKYNSASCVVTPLSECANTLRPLSKIICDGNSPKKCSKLDGVFTQSDNWYGACGCVDGTWCVEGNKYTSGEMREGRKRIYYGYCAKRI